MTIRRHVLTIGSLPVLFLSAALTTGCADSAVPTAAIPPATPIADAAAIIEEPTNTDDATVTNNEAAPPQHVERLVLLGPRGPITVHLAIDIDGQPQRAAVEQLLDKASKSGESGSGSSATWTTLAASEALTSGRFGNRPLANAMQQQQLVREFDSNRDGRVQRQELAACLAQNNAGGEPFSVQPLREYGGESQQDSPLFQLLDQDEDGRLSAAELADAAWRLQGRDANDDEVVTPADFRPPPLADPAMRNRRSSAPKRAFELNKLEIDSIYYALRERYDTGKGLDDTTFGHTRGLFAQLDADHDGIVSQSELIGLIEARGDLLLKLKYGQSADGSAKPLLEAQSQSDDLKAAGAEIHEQAGRLIIDLAGGELEVMAVDAFAQAGKPALEKSAESDGPLPYGALQVQVRAGDVEDPLFSWLDVNHDGRLTLREMQGAGKRISQLDTGADGSVTAAEIPDRLGCVILRGAGGDMGPRATYTMERRTPMDGPKWLAAMDINGDGEITPREFVGTARQFSDLDLNADGYLDASEAARAAAPPADAAPAQH